MARVQLWRLLLLMLVAAASAVFGSVGPSPATANAPLRPSPAPRAAAWQESRFTTGCAPAPYDPPPPPDPWTPPYTPDQLAPQAMQLDVDLDSARASRPLLGAGFNLEHGLWSCPAFHPILSSALLQPFHPALVRIDTGMLPAAPPELSADQLGPQVYQSVLDAPPYAEQWDMLRALNRANVKIVLGVWGGPDQFTDDGTRQGVLLPEHYSDYVDYVVAVVDTIVRQQHISVWAITIANEPDGGDGNQIPPDGLATIAHQLALRLAPYGVKLYGPDTSTASAALDYVPALLADPVVVQHLAFVAFHQYWADPQVGDLVDYVHSQQPTLPVVATEYTSFDFGDLDAGQEANSPLDFTLEVADTVLAHYRFGVDAALYWDAVDYLQPGHDAITHWGMLRPPLDNFQPRTWYYGLLQILPYLQTGARVLSTQRVGGADVGLLAVQTPDHRIGVFLVNEDPQAVDLTLDLQSTMAQVPSAFDVLRTDATSQAALIDTLHAAAGAVHLLLPGRSLTTLLSPPGPPSRAAGRRTPFGPRPLRSIDPHPPCPPAP